MSDSQPPHVPATRRPQPAPEDHPHGRGEPVRPPTGPDAVETEPAAPPDDGGPRPGGPFATTVPRRNP